MEIEYPCTQCGQDAEVGYSAGEEEGADWNRKVKKGERLCTKCFKERGGTPMF